MTKHEVIDTLRSLCNQRLEAYNAVDMPGSHPKRGALKHLMHWMPQPTWTDERVFNFVKNNFGKILIIIPENEKLRNYRNRLLTFFNNYLNPS